MRQAAFPCPPQANVLADDQTCNRIDDDCDGADNEDFVGQPCGVGVCAGNFLCVNGSVAACGSSDPTGPDDDCNGLDDDCDGSVDESFSGASCGAGVCTGHERCANGVITPCVTSDPTGMDNDCNGLDEDCDGSIDETYVGRQRGQGVCVCQDACQLGAVVNCSPQAPLENQEMSCNGLDDDCDGVVDENIIRMCQGLDIGECTPGVRKCANGQFRDCMGAIMPEAEICNGLDDDCDGTTDENVSRPCGSTIGECSQGIQMCVAGAPGPCQGAVGPVNEVCDGLDNDCDGQSDEGFSVGMPCPLGDGRMGTIRCDAMGSTVCQGTQVQVDAGLITDSGVDAGTDAGLHRDAGEMSTDAGELDLSLNPDLGPPPGDSEQPSVVGDSTNESTGNTTAKGAKTQMETGCLMLSITVSIRRIHNSRISIRMGSEMPAMILSGQTMISGAVAAMDAAV